jgi:hypothetical protein
MNQINVWKKQYGSIYRAKIQGDEYIYRTLNVGECAKVISLLEENKQTEIEEFVLCAVLSPDNIEIDETPSVVIKRLSEYIIKATNVFTEEGFKQVVQKARENAEKWMNNDLSQWKLLLLKVFPGYTLEYIDSLPIQELFNKITLAEKVTGERLIVLQGEKPNKRVERRPPPAPVDETDGQLVAANGKFMSQRELEEIGAQEAFANLREHYLQHKQSKGR